MKVLVTGGAGFIGSNLTQVLLKSNHEVIVLDNLSSGQIKNLNSHFNLQFVKGDIQDSDLLDKLLPGVSVVFHLAASVGNFRSIENPLLDTQTNAVGTLTLLEGMRRHQVPKIIVSSSAAIFGDTQSMPIDESHPLVPKTPYAVSKLYTEKISLAYADMYAIEVICLRYFNVYGPNQWSNAYNNAISIFVANALNDQPLYIYGDGNQTRDFIYVADVIQANLFCAEKSLASNIFNIGSGIKVSINQLLDELSDILNKKLSVIYVEKRASDVQDSLADISLATRVFGYQPQVSLRSGLEQYITWIQQSQSRELAHENIF